VEPENKSNLTPESKPTQPLAPGAVPTPETRPASRAFLRPWQVTRRRRSLTLATGLAIIALVLSCILGARPIANSIGLDTSSALPNADDLVTGAGSISLTPTQAPLPPGSTSCPPVAGHEVPDLEAQLLDLVNQARADAGLSAYTIDSRIHGEALVHSEDMTCYGMSHYVPPGTTPETRMKAAGVALTFHGENIGWSGRGTDEDKMMWLFNGMMAEVPPNDGHRKNFLSPHFTITGIGIYVENASGRLWLTEDFAG
jgi:uncharacterized protein YkwD